MIEMKQVDEALATIRKLFSQHERMRLELAEWRETWTDEDGTCWARPTAWAYAQSCRVRHELEAEVASLRLHSASDAVITHDTLGEVA